MPLLSPVSERTLHDSFDTMPILVSYDNPEGSIDFYLYKLNNDRSLGGVPTELEMILDEALKILCYYPLRASDLIQRFLSMTLCDVKQTKPSTKPKKKQKSTVAVSNLTKRKQKKKLIMPDSKGCTRRAVRRQ